MMQFYYSDTHRIPLPEGHRFPSLKYGLLREAVLADGTILPAQLRPSQEASGVDIRRAHVPAYIEAILAGTLGAKQQREIGLPWSEHLVRRTLATMGGAVEAARIALEYGFSAQLAGGTHHAHGGFGSGYCIFNDFAIVVLKAISEGWARRVAVIDLDVHQGDGSAALLGDRPDVFILDMYCEKNFPFRKVMPHLPSPLAAGTADKAYLRRLAELLPAVIAFGPELVLYQAGVDALSEDRLGRLNLSHAGLAARDRMVFESCDNAGIPVSLAIGGGYADPISKSVEAHANSFRIAKEVYRF